MRKEIGEHIQYQKLKFVRIVVAIYAAIQRNPGQGQGFRRQNMVGIDCANLECTNPLCDCDPCMCTEEEPCPCCIMWDGESIVQSS